MLVHYYLNELFMIETDASDLLKGAVLSPYKVGDRKWQLVVFYNWKFSPSDLNYNVQDKEIVIIVNCMCT